MTDQKTPFSFELEEPWHSCERALHRRSLYRTDIQIEIRRLRGTDEFIYIPPSLGTKFPLMRFTADNDEI